MDAAVQMFEEAAFRVVLSRLEAERDELTAAIAAIKRQLKKEKEKTMAQHTSYGSEGKETSEVPEEAGSIENARNLKLIGPRLEGETDEEYENRLAVAKKQAAGDAVSEEEKD